MSKINNVGTAAITKLVTLTKTALNDKVDKVEGKGLSANDFTAEEKAKLAGIAAEANKTVIVDDLVSTDATSALSANQGKVLDDKITAVNDVVTPAFKFEKHLPAHTVSGNFFFDDLPIPSKDIIGKVYRINNEFAPNKYFVDVPNRSVDTKYYPCGTCITAIYMDAFVRCTELFSQGFDFSCGYLFDENYNPITVNVDGKTLYIRGTIKDYFGCTGIANGDIGIKLDKTQPEIAEAIAKANAPAGYYYVILGGYIPYHDYQTAEQVNTIVEDKGYQTADDVVSIINTKVSSAYKIGGSVAFASLPTADAEHVGIVYNVTDAFTTTDSFSDGAGKSYPAGTNVVIVVDGDDYKYDALAGFVDLSDCVFSSDLQEVTSDEVTAIWNSITI